jgi:hypothetical protein
MWIDKTQTDIWNNKTLMTKIGGKLMDPDKLSLA